MADFKQNYFQRRTKDRGPKSNNRISSPEVQVIGSDGENLGVLSTNEAILIAKNLGLDLIEIASFVFKIPRLSPSLPITCTSGDEILLLDLGPRSFVRL